ncbi:MAG: AraC family transcriptional regulator, partial [Hyphomicrobiales bacterium]|nr:AraC family transcriptional regulator [Hyphomicrobiales bacterium]
QAAGCSLRNLQLLFRKDYGRTITERLRDLRLEAARERLLCGRGDDTVTIVALESGFSHLSDFARHYRDAFGEAPSQTAQHARAVRSDEPGRSERA